MALQTVSQILSPTNAPYINGTAARVRFSAAFLRNLYQGLVEKDGRGVDDNFVSASEAEDSAQIIVHRVLPSNIKPREIGSSKNGAAYSQNQHYTQTISVGIEILQVIDDPILIPRATQDMIGVDLLKEQAEIFSDRLAVILNGATLASKYLATYIEKANNNEINETVLNLSQSGDKIRDNFVLANAALDEGDEEHGLDFFPKKTRICVVKTSVAPLLKTGGVLSLGGANEAYAILKAAGISGDGENFEEDGYVGTIDGVQCCAISNKSLANASLFLGFTKYDLKKSKFYGYIASSYANARGVSTSKQTEVVKEVNGQGVRLLPYVKFGVACWYPKGNSMLVGKALNVFGELRTLFASVASAITFKVKSYGSRLYPVFGAFNFTDTTHATLTAQALDDWSNEHLKGAYYYVGDAAATTVHEFVENAGEATIKGNADLDPRTGGTITLSDAITANKFLNVLAIADDGSCSLVSKKYTA